MSKIFTVNDVQEVTLVRKMMGVEAVWCTVLFNGCTETVKFYATPHLGDEIHLGDAFQVDMYARLTAGEFGEVLEGIGEHYITIPPSQRTLETLASSTRTQLLVESDFSDLPVTQARFTDAQKTAWSTYRQSLRDITSQVGYPWNIIWPTKP
jgi:hypothetical protein